MNFSKIELLKANWIRLVREIKFSRAVTFNFGTTLLPETAASKIEEFCKRIEDKAFGRNWYKRKNGRLTVVAFMEHVDSNTHYHGYVRGGSKVRIALKRHGDRMWKKLAPRGQLDYGPILHRERMDNYFTKEMRKPGRADYVCLYLGSRGLFHRAFET